MLLWHIMEGEIALVIVVGITVIVVGIMDVGIGD